MTDRQGKYYGAPLGVNIEDGALVIRIGVQVIAHAVTYSDWANPYDEKTGDYVRSFAIEDPVEFAKDVMHAMLYEYEDGSTPLSNFIDNSSEVAVDQGSMGLHEDCEQRILHGQTAAVRDMGDGAGGR